MATATAAAITITLALTRPVDASTIALDVGGPVTGLALSPDGEVLAVGLVDGGVQVWDLGGSGSPTPSRPLPGHTDTVLAWEFSPNEDILITGSGDGTVRLWKME